MLRFFHRNVLILTIFHLLQNIGSINGIINDNYDLGPDEENYYNDRSIEPENLENIYFENPELLVDPQVGKREEILQPPILNQNQGSKKSQNFQENSAAVLDEKPKPSFWIFGRHPSKKLNLISWLIDGCMFYASSEEEKKLYKRDAFCNFDKVDQKRTVDEKLPEFQTFDGFFNNIFKVDLGAVDTPLLRRVPAAYSDGTYEPVKREINPFRVSDKTMKRSPQCPDPDPKNKNSQHKAACGSKTGKSALLVYFGQQMVEELLDVQRPGCPPEYFNIKIPKYLQEQFGNKTFMPFLRSRYLQSTGHSTGNPRQQLNEITPWIDGGLVYGTSKAWADVLRTKTDGSLEENGKLASDQDEGLFPVRNTVRLPLANPPPPAFHSKWVKADETAKVNRFFVLGNPRGNENAFLLTFGIVLFRWHNQIATYLYDSRGCRNNTSEFDDCWNGERIFQETRKWVIATYQQLVVYDFLEEWIGEPLDQYKGYDLAGDPQIEQFFQTAVFRTVLGSKIDIFLKAMRFGHTLVTPGIYLRDYACNKCKPIPFDGVHNTGEVNLTSPFTSEKSVRTCNIFWRPQEPMTLEYPNHCNGIGDESINDITDIDRLLMGMASQRAEREDNMIVEDLRGRVFGPLEFSRRDLMAINIQRGREHGTPDYNTARESFGLGRIKSVQEYMDVTGTDTPPEIVEILQEIHANLTEDDYGYLEDKKLNLSLNKRIELAWSRMDVWSGGILETTDRPGQLFLAIIKDQFTRIRNSDRFWFENTNWKIPRFSSAQIKRIKQLKVYDLLMSVTRMKIGDIQENPFRVPIPKIDTDEHFPKICRSSKYWQISDCTRRFENRTRTEMHRCFHFPQLHSELTKVEECNTTQSFDYFYGSEISFISTYVALGLFILGLVSLLPLLAITNQEKKVKEVIKLQKKLRISFKYLGKNIFPAKEWLGFNDESRQIILNVKDDNVLELRNYNGDLLRMIDLSIRKYVDITLVSDGHHILIQNPEEYDCVLEFDSHFLRDSFMNLMREKLGGVIELNQHVSNLKQCLHTAITKEMRMIKLEKFFKIVFSHAFKLHEPIGKKELLDPKLIREVLMTELSKSEFADAIGMRPCSDFFQKMFTLVDRDQNGMVNFREFLDILVIFAKGNSEEKAKLMFDMYDIERNGELSSEEFKLMIRSMMIEASNSNLNVTNEEIETLVRSMLNSVGLKDDSNVSLENFNKLFARHKDVLGSSHLDFSGVNVAETQTTKCTNTRANYVRSILGEDSPDLQIIDDLQASPIQIIEKSNKNRWKTFMEQNHQKVFWIVLYTLVVLAIFSERAYYYSIEREHSGLRHIAGYGVTVTRGAASAMMFTYATLLLTMCRNLITKMRETFLHKFIPFDSAVSMHKYIAILALIFTIIHVIGHAINFYHISTQTPEDLTCLFRDYFRQTHVLPKFHYWCFQTVTGLTGVLLVMHIALIYIFATTYARRHTFRMFWVTHKSYPVFYFLMILHGLGRLVQAPLFGNFLIGPLIIFIIDRLVTIGRISIEIPVLNAELLPSNVTKLEFAKPLEFQYKSGQWIRIACLAMNPNEFHPFTISSAPHEPNLTVHIRAVGPFTINIRNTYERSLPKLKIDGPYGLGHQDWYKYEVSVLIGGGIGVTPFASILKDVAYQNQNSKNCKKIYFIWVTRTQKQFEWLVDIIKEVEKTKMISVHIFITQVYDKFDLRTVLLYICERHFQKVSNKSLFTGLRSVSHFGRPNFDSLLRSLRKIHPTVSKFGVFSCGPLPMIKQVDEACTNANKICTGAIFQHNSENF